MYATKRSVKASRMGNMADMNNFVVSSKQQSDVNMFSKNKSKAKAKAKKLARKKNR